MALAAGFLAGNAAFSPSMRRSMGQKAASGAISGRTDQWGGSGLFQLRFNWAPVPGRAADADSVHRRTQNGPAIARGAGMEWPGPDPVELGRRPARY